MEPITILAVCLAPWTLMVLSLGITIGWRARMGLAPMPTLPNPFAKKPPKEEKEPKKPPPQVPL